MGDKPRGPLSRRTWRPELAYVVGVLVTDGNLSPTGRHVSLVSCDVDLLNTVSRILELKTSLVRHQGGYSNNAFHIVFGDRLFYDWLVEVGVTPRKTFTIGGLAIPDAFFRDFLRGHLDGDGSITAYVDRYNTKLKSTYVYQRLYVRFLSASEVHIQWLQQRVEQHLGIQGYLTRQGPRPGRKASLYRLAFAKKQAIALLRWMYYAPDVPCLARKRAIAEPFLMGELRQFRHPPGFETRERGHSAVGWPDVVAKD